VYKKDSVKKLAHQKKQKKTKNPKKKKKTKMNAKAPTDEDVQNAMHDQQNHWLLMLSTAHIQEIKRRVVFMLPDLSIAQKEYMLEHLRSYVFVADLRYFRSGMHVRWIPHGQSVLMRGSIYCDVEHHANGTFVVCRNHGPHGRYFMLPFDQHVFFRKLNELELYMLHTIDQYTH
jgi:hypothetical protein